MKQTTIDALIKLNQQFYDQVALAFDQTRQSPWPGWYELLSLLAPFEPLSAADLGCGNGRFFKFLFEHRLSPHRAVGYDSSSVLLHHAFQDPSIEYHQSDIVTALPPLNANVIVSFGVWHHIPGKATRKRMLERLVTSVKKPGIVIVSLWHVSNKHPLPIEMDDLEPGDLFIGWQNQPDAVRYCHQFDESEIQDLMSVKADTVGRFEADGKDGRSNTYLYYIVR